MLVGIQRGRSHTHGLFYSGTRTASSRTVGCLGWGTAATSAGGKCRHPSRGVHTHATARSAAGPTSQESCVQGPCELSQLVASRGALPPPLEGALPPPLEGGTAATSGTVQSPCPSGDRGHAHAFRRSPHSPKVLPANVEPIRLVQCPPSAYSPKPGAGSREGRPAPQHPPPHLFSARSAGFSWRERARPKLARATGS